MKEKELRNHWEYVLTAIDIDGEENLRYTTYGIRAVDRGGNVAASYVDISTNKDLVETIIEKCNQHDLSVLHLEDILYDYME